MLGFPLSLFFGKARHIQARRTGSAQHQVDPVQRFIRRRQRIGKTGQGFPFFFIHRQNRDMLLQELLPPRRVIGNHVFSSES